MLVKVAPGVWVQNQIDGSVQDCSNSIANALELLQSCTKLSKWWLYIDDVEHRLSCRFVIMDTSANLQSNKNSFKKLAQCQGNPSGGQARVSAHWRDPYSLQWCYTERDGVSSYRPDDCLLNCLFRHMWKKTSKLRITGLCEGNSPVTGEFPTQRASNAKDVSIWWCHHVQFSLIVQVFCFITYQHPPRQCSGLSW